VLQAPRWACLDPGAVTAVCALILPAYARLSACILPQLLTEAGGRTNRAIKLLLALHHVASFKQQAAPWHPLPPPLSFTTHRLPAVGSLWAGSSCTGQPRSRTGVGCAT
jgi:hypothetical protein